MSFPAIGRFRGALSAKGAFAYGYGVWQQGTNENTRGLLG